MTLVEIELVIKEIGRIRSRREIRLTQYDSWFLFTLANMAYNATMPTPPQIKYLLFILFRIKEGKYKKETIRGIKKRMFNL